MVGLGSFQQLYWEKNTQFSGRSTTDKFIDKCEMIMKIMARTTLNIRKSWLRFTCLMLRDILASNNFGWIRDWNSETSIFYNVRFIQIGDAFLSIKWAMSVPDFEIYHYFFQYHTICQNGHALNPNWNHQNTWNWHFHWIWTRFHTCYENFHLNVNCDC